MGNNVPYLQMKNISKSFPGVKALDNINLSVDRGEVLALMGENGAGKSTLMKILSGVYIKDEGNILIGGSEVEIKDVKSAEKLGIAIIHQELSVLPNLTVSENLFLGNELTDKVTGRLNKKEMKNAVVFLATGFEEIEALGTIDVLRRGGVRVMMVSITGDRLVIGAHDIPVMADYLFEEADFSCVDALILPGGIPGSNHLNAHAHLKELVKEKTEEGVLIGAICAGPMVLGGLGLLKGKRATCFPFFEPTMVGATPTDNGVEQDGNIITSKGPGFMFEFGLTILRNLKDEEIALEVADALLYDALLHGTKH